MKGTRASDNWKKAVRMGLLSVLGKGFNSSKCKTMAKMAVARIKLLRNKREAVIRQMRRDIAMLLQSNQDGTARIRVEHVIREQNIMAANELIELFCELLVARLSIIAKQRECPADLKEGISSLLFAGPRCSELPELLSIRDVFQKKYGKDFVSAATDLRPNAGVNRLLIEKLSVKTPSGETKLKVLKEIAKEYQVQWDTAESEIELLKPPEERIEGPTNFVSATSFPLKPVSKQQQQQPHEPNNSTNSGQSNVMSFQDLASAAGAAAEKAAAAAEAAVLLAYRGAQMSGSHNDTNRNSLESSQASCGRSYGQNTKKTGSSERSRTFDSQDEQNDNNRRVDRRQSYNCERGPRSDIKLDESDYDEEIEMEEPPSILDQSPNEKKMNRRHSYNVPPAKSDIVFDESDNEDDQEEGWGPTTGGPPERLAPQVPDRRVHPKLPDYEALAARFEALKHHKSSRT